MSKGANIIIFNQTSRKFLSKSVDSYQMNIWTFSDVQPYSQKKFYLEFKDFYFWNKKEDTAANAEFVLESTSFSFILKTFWEDIKVDWNNNLNHSQSQFIVYPPSFGGNTSDLGWKDGGTVFLMITENNLQKSLSPSLSLPLYSSTDDFLSGWMTYYAPVIEHMKIRELTFPGTHDSCSINGKLPSGSIDSIYSSVFSPLVICQDLSITEQLNQGIRVLDLRIILYNGEFFLSHGNWKFDLKLSDILKEVKNFLNNSNKSEKEIIILDFHSFHNFTNPTVDFIKLRDEITQELSTYVIDYTHYNSDSTLSDIWNSTKKNQRIIVAWEGSYHAYLPYMWPGIEQKWANTTEPSELRTFITSCIYEHTNINNPGMNLWSICSVLTPQTPTTNSQLKEHSSVRYLETKLRPEVERWFYNFDLTKELSIISVDFFSKENSRIVEQSICANLTKAVQGIKEKKIWDFLAQDLFLFQEQKNKNFYFVAIDRNNQLYYWKESSSPQLISSDSYKKGSLHMIDDGSDLHIISYNNTSGKLDFIELSTKKSSIDLPSDFVLDNITYYHCSDLGKLLCFLQGSHKNWLGIHSIKLYYGEFDLKGNLVLPWEDWGDGYNEKPAIVEDKNDLFVLLPNNSDYCWSHKQKLDWSGWSFFLPRFSKVNSLLGISAGGNFSGYKISITTNQGAYCVRPIENNDLTLAERWGWVNYPSSYPRVSDKTVATDNKYKDDSIYRGNFSSFFSTVCENEVSFLYLKDGSIYRIMSLINENIFKNHGMIIKTNSLINSFAVPQKSENRNFPIVFCDGTLTIFHNAFVDEQDYEYKIEVLPEEL